MSIGKIITAVGSFLTSPVITGVANVASIATLPVSIATKVDTDKIKKSVSSMRTDINLMSSDVLDLTQQVIDLRTENRYNVAYSGQIPVIVKGSSPQFATAFGPLAASMAAQKQNMYAALVNGQTTAAQPETPAQPQQNPPQQETPVQAPQIQPPVAPPAQAAPVQNVMVGQPADTVEMLKGMIPEIAKAVVNIMSQSPASQPIQQEAPAQPETPAQPQPQQNPQK